MSVSHICPDCKGRKVIRLGDRDMGISAMALGYSVMNGRPLEGTVTEGRKTRSGIVAWEFDCRRCGGTGLLSVEHGPKAQNA